MTAVQHSWRMVCHNCGEKFEVNSTRNRHILGCCRKPKLVMHDVEKACERCFDAEHPIAMGESRESGSSGGTE